MKSRYKIVLSGNNLYREVDLPPEQNEVIIGTAIDSSLRLRKDQFFSEFEIRLHRRDDNWVIVCSDNIYLSLGDVRKFVTKDLIHGESLQVKYQNTDNELFQLTYILDFDYETKEYNTVIDILGKERIVIGGTQNADIKIQNENIGSSFITLKKHNGYFVLEDNGIRYGVYVNGSQINKNAIIRNTDFFSFAGFSFYYKEGKLYTSKSGDVCINNLKSTVTDQQWTHYDYPEFVRNTRVQYCIPEDEIEIKQPMPKPQKTKKNLILSLIPAVTMLVLMIILRGILSNTGGMFVIYSVCSMGIGVVMSVVTFIYEGKQYKKEVLKREEDYKRYIESKEKEIIDARKNELRIRQTIYESLDDSISEVQSFGKRIFEKSGNDKDFLEIYLGNGQIESSVPIKYTQQDFIDTEDPISLIPAEIEKKYRYIENAPVVSKFNVSNGIGIVGHKAAIDRVLKNITLDIAIRHFYSDVKTYYILNETDLDSIKWIKWLHHAHNDDLGVRNIMCDDESRKMLFENLYSILSEREAIKKENDDHSFDTYYVVFVLDSTSIRNHPISKYIENSNAYGFTFVFFEEYEEFIPKGCTEIIRLGDDGVSGTQVLAENGDKQTTFTFNTVPEQLAESISLKLGAISVEEVSLESELTKSISMYELLNILSVDDLDLSKRWQTSQVFKSMAAPLGVKTKNEIVYLDISDKASAHGPHGLVAGTTGSGKSEILQTYVLSMATLFHPYDVGFVIIDFKGGGMANQFKDLPHMMGAITNIDGREINRSLLSIKAELVKRQSFFAEAGVNHINDYIKLYKQGTVSHPLPHLIIIVDEFAELKAEYPDLMKELISAARIGRTLGVHLILATQKPAGVVDAQIWSNSKFKLCLKVQTKEDSNEVIKTPLAAEIVEPGRAYFQVGNNEIFELFQSAYSGVKVTKDGDDKTKVFSIYELNNWGKRTLVYTNRKKSTDDNAKNQLQVIVDYVNSYCKKKGIRNLNGICLPPLENVVKNDALYSFTRPGKGVVVPIGVYDDPEKQDQGNYCINLSENNTYVIGSAMTGKTTLLQTILLQLMNYYTPQDVNAYIIDCGNMTLKVFENSNIVGDVALSTEEDKIVNLFKLIYRIMEERKKVFAEKGLGTHQAYMEAGYTDMPQIVIMIDNVAAFKEYYDNLSDDFLSISREGNSLGISIVATATQTNAMSYKALSNYGTRIALVCNDTGEYSNLFDRCRIEPKDTAGRGLCVIDKRILEFQTALSVEGEREIDRVENIKMIIRSCNAKYLHIAANAIPVVPDVIRFEDIKNTVAYKKSYQIPIGLSYSNVQYKMLDIKSVGLVATFGREQSGKTNFIRHLFAAVQRNVLDSYTEAYVFDNSERTVAFAKEFSFVERYTADLNEMESLIDLLEEKCAERTEMIADGRDLTEEPLVLLLIENNSFINKMQSDKQLAQRMVNLAKNAKKMKLAIIVSSMENASVTYSASDFLKYIKENKKFIVFDDISNVKLFDTTVKQVKENAKPLKLGDAFACIGSEIDRIKTIYMEVRE